jgi:hypothetical protein
MNSHSLELALKKQRLQMQCAAQRRALGEHIEGLSPVFNVADKGVRAAHWLVRRPQWLAAASAVLFVMKPRRVIRWGMRGLSIWRIVRRVGRL